jgi:hypothetical protein
VRPAIGCLEPSESALQRAGERALLVSKQLGRDERRRNRRAVHANERSARAARALVNGAGDKLFTGSGLAEYEDGGVGVRDLGNLGENTLQGGGGPNDLLEHRSVVDVFAQGEGFVAHAIFGALAIVDVGAGDVPAHDLSLLVADGDVAPEEPAVIPVLSSRAQLVLERDSFRQSFLTLGVHLGGVIRVDGSAVVGHHDIFEFESPILERGTVGKQARTGRALNDDIHRNRIGDMAPFQLVLAKDNVQAGDAIDSQSRPAFG